MSKWTPNKVTGQLQMNFYAKLVSVGDNLLQNSKGTEFAVCNIQLPSGTETSARMYAANIAKLKPETIGNSVLCTATQYEQNGVAQIDIIASHLTAAPRISADDFAAELGVTLEAPAAVAKA